MCETAEGEKLYVDIMYKNITENWISIMILFDGEEQFVVADHIFSNKEKSF